MSNRKQSKKNGSGDEEEDPKHRYIDPRTRVTKRQREKIKLLGLGNRKESKRAKKRKAQKAKKELREQERRAPENEPVVEPGNEIQNENLETVPEVENRVESTVLVLVDLPDSDKHVEYKSKPRQRLSSSSQSGSDVDRRRKAERTPSPSGSDDDSERKAGSSSSQKSQSGETSGQSGSDYEKSDEEFAKLT